MQYTPPVVSRLYIHTYMHTYVRTYIHNVYTYALYNEVQHTNNLLAAKCLCIG